MGRRSYLGYVSAPSLNELVNRVLPFVITKLAASHTISTEHPACQVLDHLRISVWLYVTCILPFPGFYWMPFDSQNGQRTFISLLSTITCRLMPDAWFHIGILTNVYFLFNRTICQPTNYFTFSVDSFGFRSNLVADPTCLLGRLYGH